MHKDEQKRIIDRALAVSSEDLAKKVAERSAQTLGRMLVKANNTRLVERQIRRLGLWDKDN